MPSTAKNARIIMPHMYGLNVNYFRNSNLPKNNKNTVIKFLEGAKRSWPRESYNIRYYNWFNSNRVKNAIRSLIALSNINKNYKTIYDNVIKSL